MALPMTQDAGIDVIKATIAECIPDADDSKVQSGMARGILAALMVGYGMDNTAFLAVHGHRLRHLTLQTLNTAGWEVPTQPGDVPRGV